MSIYQLCLNISVLFKFGVRMQVLKLVSLGIRSGVNACWRHRTKSFVFWINTMIGCFRFHKETSGFLSSAKQMLESIACTWRKYWVTRELNVSHSCRFSNFEKFSKSADETWHLRRHLQAINSIICSFPSIYALRRK